MFDDFPTKFAGDMPEPEYNPAPIHTRKELLEERDRLVERGYELESRISNESSPLRIDHLRDNLRKNSAYLRSISRRLQHDD